MSITLPDVVLIHYAVTKDLLSRLIKTNTDTCFVNILAGILCGFVLTGMGILSLPFLIFRACLAAILKIKYRELYAGLMNGTDTVFELHEDAIVINLVAIYSCTNDISGRIVLLRAFIDSVHKSIYNFACSINNVCGYVYLIKNQVKSEDVLEIVNPTGNGSITKAVLYDYIQQNCYTIKEKYMWKVYALMQPIEWSDRTRTTNKQYCLIFSFRHSLGDLPSIMGILKNFLNVDCAVNEQTTPNSEVSRSRSTLGNTYLYSNPLLRSMEAPKLKINDNWDWYLTTYIESQPKYLPMIRALRKKLNVSFVDVIGAAIFSSVKDYILQRKVNTNTVTGAVIMRMHHPEINEILNRTYNFKQLRNAMGAIGYDIPCQDPPKNMRNEILSFHRTSEVLRNATDCMTIYSYCRDISTYMPTWYSRLFYDNVAYGGHIGITNLVGFDKTTYGTSGVDDVFFCVPNFCGVGFTFSIFTYDRRMGISLTSGRGYVHNRDELHTILDNTFKYIDQAAEDILVCEDIKE